jgi:predicted site-specific integrase-resolvase
MASPSSNVETEPLYLRPKDAAKLLGISIPTLDRLKRTGEGPSFTKPTRKICLYAVAVLRAWADRNPFTNTTQARLGSV